MSPTLIIGYGPVGRAVTDQLQAAGRTVIVAQRSRPVDLPADVEFRTLDCLDRDAVVRAVQGVSQVVLTAGLAYVGKVWLDSWPKIIANLLDACAASDARLIWADNLYMYGPQDVPLHEALPLSDFGQKPRARSIATRLWQEAAATGRVRVVAVRAPDFYGPGVTLSHFGSAGLQALAREKAATLLVPPDVPHDVAYVPDIARAIVTLLDAPDDAFGQAWHVPCAPTLTSRQLLALGAKATGRALRLRSIPLWLCKLAGGVVPAMGELAELHFTWDRPYHVDATKWRTRFGWDATSFAEGVRATVASY